MEKKILLLGHNGMLGQMVDVYFGKKGHQILKLKHRFEPESRIEFIEEIKSHPDALVINAIGKIKQKTDNTNSLLWANAVLPLTLRQIMPKGQRLVHPSTDCVFKGDKGEPYSIDDEPDATDDYGWSKHLGELALLGRPNTLIPRVSIIGPDKNVEGKGLMNWFLRQPNQSELMGFENHYWNGITTFEWCKQVEKVLNESDLSNSILLQLGTKEFYSKYEMLNLFSKYFNSDSQIKRIETDTTIDRRLTTNFPSPSLEEQLEQLNLNLDSIKWN